MTKKKPKATQAKTSLQSSSTGVAWSFFKWHFKFSFFRLIFWFPAGLWSIQILYNIFFKTISDTTVYKSTDFINAGIAGVLNALLVSTILSVTETWNKYKK